MVTLQTLKIPGESIFARTESTWIAGLSSVGS
jgi:hypothetical protein